METRALISIQDLNISLITPEHGSVPLITSLNLKLNPGECSLISSPTGTGKTTMLNLIAGLLQSQQAQNSFDISGTIQKTEGLKTAYAFQEPRLIPSLSVIRNVMLPLENLMDKAKARELAFEMLETLNLSHKTDVLPGQLSGGEKQRTGLARAFAYSMAYKASPCLLLLDEPYASQDTENARIIQENIQNQIRLPLHAALVISHDRNSF